MHADYCTEATAICPTSSNGYHTFTANYLIIANRQASPTAAQNTTFGELKARYRGEREPTSPDDR